MHFIPAIVLLGTLLAGCRPCPLPGGPPPDLFLLHKTDPATTPPFEIDPSRDYRIEFGRGSGMSGLDTVAFGTDGIATLHRAMPERGWETATLTFSKEALARILSTIRGQKIMHMAAGYHANVHDGTQWVLWITQGNQSKSIYFNNHFPDGILRFAQIIDTELQQSGYSGIRWKKVPPEHERDHGKALWNSAR
jgi:hypothetical protein